MANEQNQVAVYVCTNRRCRKYKQEWRGTAPGAFSMATGRGVSCPECGESVWLRRMEPVPAAAAPCFNGNHPRSSDGVCEFDGGKS